MDPRRPDPETDRVLFAMQTRLEQTADMGTFDTDLSRAREERLR
jgi:hypothetical protein